MGWGAVMDGRPDRVFGKPLEVRRTRPRAVREGRGALTEELRKHKKRSDDSEGRERTRPGQLCYDLFMCAAVVSESSYNYILFQLN